MPAFTRSSALLVFGVIAALAGSLVMASADGTDREPGVPARGIEVPVTAMNEAVGPANNSPTLVADPADERFLALANRLDGPDFSCALHVSGDAGLSWAELRPVPELPPGAEKCYAPEVGFDRGGRLYYLFVGLAGRGNEPMGAFLTTSADRGRTFTRPRRVLGPLSFGVRMAIDRGLGKVGRIHLAWIKATSDPPLGGFGPPPNPILSAYSDDGGRTFSVPVQVNDARRARVVAPTLALGADHRVHVAYYDLEEDAVDYQGLEGPVWEDNWSIVLATSTDDGRFRQSVVDVSVAPPERVMLIFTMTPPALAVRGDMACVAWADARRGDPDIVARCSNDGARTWGRPARLNDDRAGNGLTQLMPRLAFSPDGRIDAIFYDRRRHPANVLNHVFFTFSTNGGRSWAPNRRITRHASSSTVGPQYANPSAQGKIEFGSRLGLLSRSNGAVATWTDTRNSPLDGAGQDVFSTVLRLRPASRSNALPTTAGAALVLIGAVAALWGLRGRRRRTATSPGGVPDQ